MNRGYYSLALGALLVIALAGVAGLQAAQDHAQSAQESALQARLLGQRSQDAARVLDRVLEDALLDGAYQACGCGHNDSASLGTAALNTTLATYLLAAAANLTDDRATLTIQRLDLSLPSAPAACDGWHNLTLSVALEARLQTASAQTVLNATAPAPRYLSFNRTDTQYDLNLTRPADPQHQLIVQCA